MQCKASIFCALFKQFLCIATKDLTNYHVIKTKNFNFFVNLLKMLIIFLCFYC